MLFENHFFDLKSDVPNVNINVGTKCNNYFMEFLKKNPYIKLLKNLKTFSFFSLVYFILNLY